MLSVASRTGGVLLCMLWLLLAEHGRGQLPAEPLPAEFTWKLSELDKEPLRLVATQYDAKARIVMWTLEFTRDLDPVEEWLYWAPAFRFEKRPLIRFEFQSANGILLKTIDPRYFGEYVTKKGKRFGAVLAIPDDAQPNTKVIEAVIR